MSVFQSFLMGGFESSAHRRLDGVRLDMIAATHHDRWAEHDYAAVARHGLRTVRDGLRWHLIEATPGHYDWSSWLPMLHAAERAGVQVIWDLCHYGMPDWIDVDDAGFPQRFAAYARAAALVARDTGSRHLPPVYCVLNEVSYWAWAVGQGHMEPMLPGGGARLKRVLVRAAIVAMDAIREVEPHARFLHPEPLVHVVPREPENAAAAEAYRVAQFETFDMLSGRIAPELGGTPRHLDLLGANFYCDNQWFHEGGTIPFATREYRPFRHMLAELHARYDRPIVVSESGAEAENGPAWLRHVAGEVRRALRDGIAVLGLCLYPVADYPGWSNARHCRCGLLALAPDWQRRSVDVEIAAALAEEQAIGFAPPQHLPSLGFAEVA